MPKLIAVIGGKHSGKTTVIEHLIGELKHRGYRVGAIKEMVRIPTLDTPATETYRYSIAGAETIVAVPRDETVVFIKRRLNIEEILPFLIGLDYVVLEGFESEKNLLKIIAAKTADEAKNYYDNFTIAVSGIITESEIETNKAVAIKVPIFSLNQTEALADLIEKKTVEM
jgi:molybdopterin-guanine dinucleotide biosynthesis adapter protein